jgi:P pilus assembly chaperone PapD
VVALVGLWAHLLLAAPAAAQVAVEDLEVHLQLRRDTAALVQVIPVKNEEQKAQQVRITVGDWVRDSLGNNQFLPAKSTAASCGDRLRVFPTTFQVAPGATELVRVAYQPTPADAGCWSIVFIETVAPPAPRPDGQGSFLTLEIRTGVKIYVHRANAHRDGAIESGDVGLHWRIEDPASGRRDSIQVREATVLFANTGTAHLRVQGTLEVRDATGKLLHTVAGHPLPMTPGSARYVGLRVPDLPKGDYIALMLLDYGGDEIAAAQLDFRVP